MGTEDQVVACNVLLPFVDLTFLLDFTFFPERNIYKYSRSCSTVDWYTTYTTCIQRSAQISDLQKEGKDSGNKQEMAHN
jgi:hypothetical protein